MTAIRATIDLIWFDDVFEKLFRKCSAHCP